MNMIMCIGEKMKTQRKTLTISKETTGTGLNRGDKLNERWINISAEKFVESSAHEIADEFTRVSTIETARFVSLAHGHQLSTYGSDNGGLCLYQFVSGRSKGQIA